MQTAPTHTPGPWYHSDAYVENLDRDAIRGDNEALIAIVWQGAHDNGLLSEAEVEANARLIAAAPDLLAACRTALAVLQDMTVEDFKHGKDVTARRNLADAIHKAEGRTA